MGRVGGLQRESGEGDGEDKQNRAHGISPSGFQLSSLVQIENRGGNGFILLPDVVRALSDPCGEANVALRCSFNVVFVFVCT